MSTTTIARCWSIQRGDGFTLGFTDHDDVLAFADISFRPDSGLSASAIVQAAGMSVDNSEAEGALTDDAITEKDLLAGKWDGAELRMWEVDWTRPSSRRLLFRGTLGEVLRNGQAFRAELRGLSEALNGVRGRVYHPRCSAQLGDAKCRFDLNDSAFSAEAVIEAFDGDVEFGFSGLGAFAAGWFDHGVVEVLSGPAKGLRGRIKNDISAAAIRKLVLWETFGIAPEIGDHVKLLAGCDKRSETCRKKFLNFLNFRGFPHVPAEDWLMAPQAGSGHG